MRILLSVFLLSITLFATEMDQFTLRDQYESSIFEYTGKLNALTVDYLDRAVNSYNEEHCGGVLTLQESRKLLAFEIWKEIAAEKRYRREPVARDHVPWFHAYNKVGKGPLQKHIIEDADRGYIVKNQRDVFDFLSLVSKTYTMKVGETLIGIDKVDHFFDQGYEYFLSSEYGRFDKKAIGYGASGEGGWYGLIVSGVFSYADLKANYDGYMFYKNLLGSGSIFKLDMFSCVHRAGQFKWQDIVDWEYDELLNGSLYSRNTYRKIENYIKKNIYKFNYCKTYNYAIDNNLFGNGENRSLYYVDDVPEGLLKSPFERTLRKICR